MAGLMDEVWTPDERTRTLPIVVLTSNRTRDVHDALKRRCLYHWVEHPDFEREVAIVRLRAPQVVEGLARQVAAAVEAMRGLELYKPPGVAETIDWAVALGALGQTSLDEAVLADLRQLGYPIPPAVEAKLQNLMGKSFEDEAQFLAALDKEGVIKAVNAALPSAPIPSPGDPAPAEQRAGPA